MTVRLDISEGIATLTLDRPDKVNALSQEMYDLLYEHSNALSADPEVRAIVLTGAGKGFCSGGDIGNMAKTDLTGSRARSKSRHRTFLALAGIEKPVIAAVHGPVYGIGSSLMFACDLIVAAQSTTLALSFKRVAVVPDGGSIYFLAQYLGIAKAKELVYTGRKVSAEEMVALNIALKVVPDGALLDEARALATEMARSPTWMLGLTKKMFQFMYTPTLEQLLDYEALMQTHVRMSDDHKEGVAAFKEKRSPAFKGR
ncbi:MAG: enoyl-CoA hydratase/isomerase family protein [Proteobacteria bacterium]|nr:enoyl-CoA hydratase/isomerase family protein [Burkholderiales bacterium]